MDPRIENLLGFLESRACDCEWIVGWKCDIHKAVDELRDLISEKSIDQPVENGTRVVCPACLGEESECSRCGNERLVLWSTLSEVENQRVNDHIADVLLCKTCEQLFCRCTPNPD